MMRALALVLVCAALAACNGVRTVQAQATGPGTVTVSWVAPTTNTDGSPITGTLTYIVYEMQPCQGGATTCPPMPTLATVVPSTAALTAQITGVSPGWHWYSVEAVEALPDGSTTSSALTNQVGALVASTTPVEPSPNPPSGLKVAAG